MSRIYKTLKKSYELSKLCIFKNDFERTEFVLAVRI